MDPSTASSQATTLTLRRTYRYRIYPSKKQVAALEEQLAFNCDLYNAALEQRGDWYRHGQEITLYDQMRQLTDLRTTGGHPLGMSVLAQRDPLIRLDRAFAAFLRRCKAGGKPGYPRFRSKRRYDSLTWPMDEGARVDRSGGELRLLGVGGVKVKWHRAIPDEADLRTVTVKRSCGKWYVSFSLTVAPSTLLPANRPPVGVDLGIMSLVALSTGETITGPRSYRTAQRGLRVAQRKVARRKRGSKRRRKAANLVARRNEHVRNVRHDFLHKLSRRLVSEFGLIAMEKLNLKGLAASRLAKDVLDQGWGALGSMIDYKAEGAGSQRIEVDPRNTSQLCSGCWELVPKDLSCRVHRCPFCGLVLDRDVNSARVILALGLDEAVRRQREAVACALPEKPIAGFVT